jgi:hypothetical protein
VYACSCLLLSFAAGAAASWSAQLETGAKVSVDPQTNRVTVQSEGVSTPLWDGVHRLSDGTTITVRAGQVVPTAAILDARQQPEPPLDDPARAWVGSPIIGLSPCEQLVRQVCGVSELCATAEACAPARQLLQQESAERAAGNPDVMVYSSGQCMEALKDAQFFKPCLH